MSRPKALVILPNIGGVTLGLEYAGFDIPFVLSAENTQGGQTHRYNFPHIPSHPVNPLRLDIPSIGGDGELDLLAASIPYKDRGDTERAFKLRRVQVTRLLSSVTSACRKLQPKVVWIDSFLPAIGLEVAIRQLRDIGYRLCFSDALTYADYGVANSGAKMATVAVRGDIDLDPISRPLSTVSEPLTASDALYSLSNLEDEAKSLDEAGNTVYSSKYMSPDYSFYCPLGDDGRNLAPFSELRKDEGIIKDHIIPDIGRARQIRYAAVTPGHKEPFSNRFRLKGDLLAPAFSLKGKKLDQDYERLPIHYFHVRPITIREAARLQSFPDWFAFLSSYNKASRRLHNATPPLLAYAIASDLHCFLSPGQKQTVNDIPLGQLAQLT